MEISITRLSEDLMNEYENSISNLPPNRIKYIQVSLCNIALEKWIKYTNRHKNIRYTESICGTKQIVNVALPGLALNDVIMGTSDSNANELYLEPISALQDMDLTFPGEIESAYYAIYNLYRKYIQIEEVDDWLIISQALESVGNSDERQKILYHLMGVQSTQDK
jgi:hypothetical protein